MFCDLVAKLKSSFLQYIIYSLEWFVLAFPRVALTESRERDERELYEEAAQDANVSQTLETISDSLENWPWELRTTALIILRGPLFIINRLSLRGDSSSIYDYKLLPSVLTLALTHVGRMCVWWGRVSERMFGNGGGGAGLAAVDL